MAHDGQDIAMVNAVVLDDLLTLTDAAIAPAQGILDTALAHMRQTVVVDGRVSGAAVEANQDAAHGLAWLATYVEALRQMQTWATGLTENGKFGEVEQLIHQIAFGEYLNQMRGGIQMNQGEIIRLSDLALTASEIATLDTPQVMTLVQSGNSQA